MAINSRYLVTAFYKSLQPHCYQIQICRNVISNSNGYFYSSPSPEGGAKDKSLNKNVLLIIMITKNRFLLPDLLPLL